MFLRFEMDLASPGYNLMTGFLKYVMNIVFHESGNFLID
jgi:hypothetical protein